MKEVIQGLIVNNLTRLNYVKLLNSVDNFQDYNRYSFFLYIKIRLMLIHEKQF